MMHRRSTWAAAISLALGLAIAAGPALATPPAHAPAHGWRAKNDPYYVGYTGNRWERDYGIRGGHCDRREVGTVVGAVVGGAIGSAVGKGDDRLVAILVGSAIGAVVGREIGRDMDSSDRACMGHALELAEAGQWVRWDGNRDGLHYALKPGDGFDRDGYACRRFTLERDLGGHSSRKDGSACRIAEGEWRLM
jgi:surface antigen